MFWQTSRFQIDLRTPKVMGIVNLTPDSFSDGGQFDSPQQAIAHAQRMVEEGADILDIGGESTRPGAPKVPLAQELARVMPVIQELVRWQIPISIDTYKPEVMQAALDAGVDIINDIWALRQPGALQAVAAHPHCGVCLMHMHGEPATMQLLPMQGEVVTPVAAFLKERLQTLMQLGVQAERVVLDPGVGFGKTVAQNFSLLAQQQKLLALGRALLVGWSRKSSLGAVTGCEVQDRLVPSVAAALLGVERGAHLVRVHDVAATVAALKVHQAARDVQASETVQASQTVQTAAG